MQPAGCVSASRAQVRHLLGRQPVREFEPLRRVVKVQDGCEYSFGPPVRPSCRDSKVWAPRAQHCRP